MKQPNCQDGADHYSMEELESIVSKILDSGKTEGWHQYYKFRIVLLVIVFASGRAVRPIAESHAKQKQFVTDAGFIPHFWL